MKELVERMEKYAVEYNIPIMQAEGLDFMLEFINKHHITRILEIGAAIGYSAIRMCMVDDEIEVTTIERDEVRYNEAVKNIHDVGMEERIHLIFGDALECQIEGTYDLIFIDAAKAQYIKFFERYIPNLQPNGYVISDNLSFHGLVGHEEQALSRSLKALVRKIGNYISYLQDNTDFETHFYELGDGIAVSERKKMIFDGYIFDMDGLLVDSETVARESWQIVAKRHGFELPWSTYQKFLGHSVKDIKEIFEREVDTDTDFQIIREEAHQEGANYYKMHGIQLMKGAKELLEYLKANGKPMVVATSTYQNAAIDRLKLAGIYDYFDAVISGDMIEHSKPDPDIFLKALEKLGTEKLNTVILEDSNSGIEAAYRAGIRSIMVPGLLAANDDSQKNSYRIMSSLLEVKKYLEENEK